MTNPFEDEAQTYTVLRNDEGQYSLWPVWINVPAGWQSVFSPGTRQACLEFINQTWTDLRPLSLIRAMEETRTPDEVKVS